MPLKRCFGHTLQKRVVWIRAESGSRLTHHLHYTALISALLLMSLHGCSLGQPPPPPHWHRGPNLPPFGVMSSGSVPVGPAFTWMLICCHLSKCKGPCRLCCCFASPHASRAQSRNRHQMPWGFQWTSLSASVHLQTQCWLAGPRLSGRLLWLPQSSVFEKHHGSKGLYNKASVSLPGRPAGLEKKQFHPFQWTHSVLEQGCLEACEWGYPQGRHSDDSSVDCCQIS